MFIDSALAEGEGKCWIEVENPAIKATITAVTLYRDADAGDPRPAWSHLPGTESGKTVEKLATAILIESDHLVLSVVSHKDKPLGKSRGEIDATAMFLQYAAEQVRCIRGEILPQNDRDADLRIRRVPYCVVVPLVSWKYTRALGGRKPRPALAAGNTVVRKGRWYRPAVMLKFWDTPLTDEEIFGLIAPVVIIDDRKVALEADATEYGLSGELFRQDIHRLTQTAPTQAFGAICVNRSSGEIAPGFNRSWKNSGLGGEEGQSGFKGYLRKKAMYVNWADAGRRMLH